MPDEWKNEHDNPVKEIGLYVADNAFCAIEPGTKPGNQNKGKQEQGGV